LRRNNNKTPARTPRLGSKTPREGRTTPRRAEGEREEWGKRTGSRGKWRGGKEMGAHAEGRKEKERGGETGGVRKYEVGKGYEKEKRYEGAELGGGEGEKELDGGGEEVGRIEE